MRIPTKHLKIFLSVVEHGNLARAALESHRAHSAVARSIVVIEEALKFQLFQRHTKGMAITETGRIFARRVRYAMREMQNAKEKLADHYPPDQTPPRNARIYSLSINERHLIALLMFAERPHIAGIAESLGVSQPAISTAFQNIEADLELSLIDRSTPILRLTPAGMVICDHLYRAMAQLRLAKAELNMTTGEPKETVTIGALPFARTYILPVALARLHTKYPKLLFRTEEGKFNYLSHQLYLGNIDLIVGALPTQEVHSEFERELLFTDQLRLMVRASHPLLKQKYLSLQDALSLDWVLPRPDTPTRKILTSVFNHAQIPEPIATVESSDLSIIRGLLLESNMVTAASKHLFHHELRTGALKTLPISLETGPRILGILRRSKTHTSPGAEFLISEIRRLSNLDPTKQVRKDG